MAHKSARAVAADKGRLAVITGMFDPITLGHVDVIRRASRIFGSVVVGVGNNPEKRSLFSLAERVELVRACVADLPGVEVRAFEGLAVAFVRAVGAAVVVRGLRSAGDLEYELTMAETNRSLEPELETVFLAARPAYRHISSTLIRQVACGAGRRQLARFVPRPVIGPLLERVRELERRR